MIRWAPIPFVRITLFFLAGILLYIYREGNVPLMREFTIGAGGLFLLFFFLNERRPSFRYVNLAGITGLLCVLGLGFLRTQVSTATSDPRHLLHQADTVSYYVGRVADYLVEKEQTSITTLELSQALVAGEWQPVTGLVRLTIRRDSAGLRPLYGDRLLIQGRPVPTRGPANPFQFDYRRYLAWRNIHHQHYVTSGRVVRLNGEPAFSLVAGSVVARRQMDRVLREKMTSHREYSIASALLLGVKDELDNDIRAAYANTGTMHVLAVSGLHVGIIFGFLNLFLLRFRRVPGYRFLSAGIILTVLTLYAYLTGLSPSVLRAVLMFSAVTIGTLLRRQKSTFNTLAFVALALLAYNPFYVMEVGFQLSFLAVLAIVYLQPRLYRLVQFENKALDWGWQLITLSVAAQLATFPLGLLYFNQFPAYFLFSNLLVVPWAGIVLHAGLVFLLVSGVPLLGEGAAWVFEWLVWLMNAFIRGIEGLPYSTLTGLTITNAQAWILYAAIGAAILFLQLRKLAWLLITCLLAAAFAAVSLRQNWHQAGENTFVVYSVRGKSALAFLEGEEATLLTGEKAFLTPSELQFHIWPHLWHSGIRTLHQKPGGETGTPEPASFPPVLKTPDGNRIYVWRGLKVLVLKNRLRFLPAQPVSLDLVVVQNNVPLRPEDLLSSYRSGMVILDPSNRPFYLRRTRQEFAAAGISVHSVPEQGAFVLRLRAEDAENRIWPLPGREQE